MLRLREGLNQGRTGQLSYMEPTAARGDQTDPQTSTGDNLIETRGDPRNAPHPPEQEAGDQATERERRQEQDRE